MTMDSQYENLLIYGLDKYSQTILLFLCGFIVTFSFLYLPNCENTIYNTMNVEN